MAGVVLLAAALTACGASSPEQELAALTSDVTRSANDEDAAGLREAADKLAAEVRDQRDAGTLAPGEAERLLALAEELRAKADRIDPEVARREAEERAAAEREAQQAREREAAARAEAERQAAAEQAERQAAERAAAEKAAAEQAAREKAAAEQAARERAANEEEQGEDDEEAREKGEKRGKKDAEEAED